METCCERGRDGDDRWIDRSNDKRQVELSGIEDIREMGINR